MRLIAVNQGLAIRTLPLHITSSGRFGNLPLLAALNQSGFRVSFTWGTANRAIYSPVAMPSAFTIARFMVANNNNASGTADVGLYSAAGKKLFSTGATARSTVNVLEYYSVTAANFPAGFYYLALLCSSATAQIDAALGGDTPTLQASGFLQENVGAATLPTTMTPAQYTAQAIPSYGFTQSATL